MCYSILSLILMKNCVFTVRELPNVYIPFGSAELFLYPGESKILRQRLLEKFVPWEDGSSSTVEVKNKKRRKVKRTAVSDAVAYLMRMFLLKMLKRILVMLGDRA